MCIKITINDYNIKVVYCNPDFCTVISKLLHLFIIKLSTTEDISYLVETFFYITLGYKLQHTFETTTTGQERLNGFATSNIHRDDPVIINGNWWNGKKFKKKTSISQLIIYLSIKYTFLTYDIHFYVLLRKIISTLFLLRNGLNYANIYWFNILYKITLTLWDKMYYVYYLCTYYNLL